MANPEQERIDESPDPDSAWRLWGPYVSARQWGTVREDYSADGNAWDYVPFDQAHLRAYRWGEDGLGAWCDRYGFLNLGLALWNGHDDRLKERPFGLTNAQGNHGEDVKEYWWPQDCTPTHSYSEWLYRYPQAAYPYADLLRTNAARDRTQPEYELSDTGILADDRYFDVVQTHAKATPTDLIWRIDVTNRGPEPAPLDVVAQAWFRNTWAWGRDARTPSLRRLETIDSPPDAVGVVAEHAYLGRYVLLADESHHPGTPELLFCDNETNTEALFGSPNPSPHPKNAIDQAVVHADPSLLNGADTGTKVGFHWHVDALAPGATARFQLRLCNENAPEHPFGAQAEQIIADRRGDADAFYAAVIPAATSPADAVTARRAFAGLMWNKQVYRYDVAEWLAGDPAMPPPPPERRAPGHRNVGWENLALADVMSMPDEWEYPWFAAWDLAFHCVAFAHVDPAFAKSQLTLLLREWAMHPDGQLPAYEWSFSDVNPPVHAWAAWLVYCIDGRRDTDFLTRAFVKLLMNFSWWVNRKDADGSNLFEGGFLGMDNIGLFDRSKGFDAAHRLEQSDATSWMAFFCLTMMRIALELARSNLLWDDMATKFLEHFLQIAAAMERYDSPTDSLWDDEDGFFTDVLVAPDGTRTPIKIHSMVGLLPLLAVCNLPDWVPATMPDVTRRMRWLQQHKPAEMAAVATAHGPNGDEVTLALLNAERYQRILARLVDENEFWSPHGIRALSAIYRTPMTVELAGQHFTIAYAPGESDSALFGGNSNWRGPVWFPVNVLVADALRTYADGVGATLSVEYPTGSGQHRCLHDIAVDLDDRLIALFRPGPDGRRPSTPRDHGSGPLWDHPTFSEYFHGDTGVGLGASHQTGWTAIVAHLICRTDTQGD